MPKISWFDGCGSSVCLNDDSVENLMIDELSDLFLFQCVRSPTFQSDIGDDGNILDLILTNEPERIVDIETLCNNYKGARVDIEHAPPLGT